MPAREKSIIESTKTGNHAILVGIMSKTIRKYQVRDRANKYQRIENRELEDKYYTDVAKSHDRKIRKKGLENYPEDGEDSSYRDESRWINHLPPKA